MPEIPDTFLGPAAGVATSLLWVFTSLFFTAAGKRLGPLIVNTIRILIAILFLAVTHRALTGLWIPDIGRRELIYLALSGIIGLAIGDQALFTAFVYIGPRLSTLVMTTSPLLAALLGWIVLDEKLTPVAMLGILLTVGGVAWVVLERPQSARSSNTDDLELDGDIVIHAQRKIYAWGVALATVGALCQAGGLLLSKQGMGHTAGVDGGGTISPQAATYVRMSFAAIGVLPMLAVSRLWLRPRSRSSIVSRSDSRWSTGLAFTFAGAVAGPYLGVWLSLVAVNHAPVGVAQTLLSLTPIFILPFAVWINKERVTLRAIVGAVIAVGGAALLFMPTDEEPQAATTLFHAIPMTDQFPPPAPGVQPGGTRSGM